MPQDDPFAILFGRIGLFALSVTVADLAFMLMTEERAKSGGRILRWRSVLMNQILPFALLFVIAASPYWLTVIVQRYGGLLIAVIDGPEAVPAGVVLALIFYRLRVIQPFVYGVIELVVATVVLWFSANSLSGDLLAKALGVLGAVYIFVRGLDNMSKRLPESWKRFWGEVFPSGR